MLSFNQVLMSSGNAAGSEQEVEERGCTDPICLAQDDANGIASPRSPSLHPSRWQLQLSVEGSWLFGWFILNTSSLLNWCDLSLAKDQSMLLPLGKAQFGAAFNNYSCCPHNLTKFLPARCSQGLKVGFSSTQYFENVWLNRMASISSMAAKGNWNAASGIVPRVCMFALQPYSPSFGTIGFHSPPSLCWLFWGFFCCGD